MIKNLVTIFVLISVFLILISMGFWQLDRLKWKTDIINAIEIQEKKDPLKTPLNLSKAIEFQQGYLDGSFLPIEPVIVTPRTHNGEVGSHIIRAFHTATGEDILVNIGWVKNDIKPQSPDIMPGRIGGYLKYPDTKNSFTPQNNSANGLYYWIDMPALAQHFKVETLSPYIFYMRAPDFGNITPFESLPKPRNKHAQYALFWFGMAGLLFILTLIFTLRKKIGIESPS